MTTKEAIKKFYFYQVESGRSCAKLYRSILEDLPSQDADITSITFSQLQDHLASFKGLAPATKNLKVAAVRSFFRWLSDASFISNDPSRLLKCQKVIQPEAQYMTKAEIKRFRKVIAANARDQLLFELYIGTGARLSEIASLNIGDVRNRKAIRVVGKGRKIRSLFLPIYISKMVKKSVNGAPDDVPLFISYRGSRLSVSGINGLFRHYLKAASIRRKLSIHSMRHSFGTYLYESCRDLLFVSRALGHSQITTTQRYVHSDMSAKQKFLNNLYQ